MPSASSLECFCRRLSRTEFTLSDALRSALALLAPCVIFKEASRMRGRTVFFFFFFLFFFPSRRLTYLHAGRLMAASSEEWTAFQTARAGAPSGRPGGAIRRRSPSDLMTV